MRLNLQKKDDYHIYMLLRIKFNGFEDIIKKIINIKNEDLLNKIRDDYIERDFYNWLNCDIGLRYQSSIENDDSNVSQYLYYYRNHKILGLESYNRNNIYDCLRRTTGLNECFKSKWWKSTAKSRTEWEIIHRSIIMEEPLYIWNLERENTYEDIINVDINNWRKPKFIEKCIVNNKIYYYKVIINIDMHDLFDDRIFLTKELKLII